MNLQLVVIVVGLLATIATSLWGIRLNNSRGDRIESRIDERLGQMDTRLAQMDARMDVRFAQQDARIDSLRSEMNHRFDGLQRDFNQFYLITGKQEGRLDAIEKRPS